MKTHSSILAWEIPWTEDPGRLQSPGFCGGEFSYMSLMDRFDCFILSHNAGKGFPLKIKMNISSSSQKKKRNQQPVEYHFDPSSHLLSCPLVQLQLQ